MKKKYLIFALLGFLLIFIFYCYLVFHVYGDRNFSKYTSAAKLYIEGNFEKIRMADFSPLYLHVNIFLEKIGLPVINTLKLLHIFLIIVSGFFLYKIIENYFSVPTAFIGLLLFLFDRHILIYSGILEPEIFMVFFITGFLYFSTGKRGVEIFLSGFFFSLTLLTRANLLILFFIALVFLWIKWIDDKKRRVKFILIFSVPVMFVLTGLSVWNNSIHSNFSPIVMNPGTVFYEGNNPCSTGKSAVYPLLLKQMAGEFPEKPDYLHVLYREFPSRVLNQELSVMETNKFWANKAMNYIEDHPMKFISLLGTKLNFIFNSFLRHDIALSLVFEKKIQNFIIPGIPFFILSSLSVIGLFLERRNLKEKLLIYSGLFIQIAILMTTYVSARQRCTILPFFLIFAASTIFNLFKRRKKMLFSLIIIFSLFFLFQIKNDLMHEEEHLWHNQAKSIQMKNMAIKSRDSGQHGKAMYLSSLSYASSPWLSDWVKLSDLPYKEEDFKNRSLQLQVQNSKDFSSNLDTVTLLLQAGMPNQAEKILYFLEEGKFKFLRNFEQSSEIYFYKARAKILKGEKKSALNLFYKGLERSPGDPYLLSHVFALTENPEYLKKIQRYIDKINAYFFVGKALIENNKYEKAIRYLKYVTEKIPEFRRSWIYYAVALGKSGFIEKAVHCYSRALEINRDPVFFEKEILELFNKWYNLNKDNKQVLLLYSSVLKQMGYFKKSLEIQRQAMELNSHKKNI